MASVKTKRQVGVTLVLAAVIGAGVAILPPDGIPQRLVHSLVALALVAVGGLYLALANGRKNESTDA